MGSECLFAFYVLLPVSEMKKCILLLTHLLPNIRLPLKPFINSQLAKCFWLFVDSLLLALLFGELLASATTNPINQLPAAYSTSTDAFKSYLIVFLVAASGIGLMGAFIKSIRGA